MDLNKIDYSDELILIVDDDKVVRELFVEMLRHLGFRVYCVRSAKEALAEIGKKPYTFLLTDIRMPEMDGLELIRDIRNNSFDLCTIAMTAYSKKYSYVDVINAGATDFINKPFNIEELEAKVRRGIIERNNKKELARLSITDSLTGLYNQRHFYAKIEEEITRAQRQKSTLALILFDLDNFKAYNDINGHVAGDALLKIVGNIVNDDIRQVVDSGFRYGGDEFAIILTDSDKFIVKKIASRIEKAIIDKCFLGASIGYAIYSNEMSAKSFVSTADEHLYKIKRKRKAEQKESKNVKA